MPYRQKALPLGRDSAFIDDDATGRPDVYLDPSEN